MGRNVTIVNMNGMGITHTRCLPKDFTCGVPLKTNIRVIKNDATIIYPDILV